MSVGARIRDQREARKMSQAGLAKEVGVSSAAIWNWEMKGRVPRQRVLARVAETLNVSEQYLAEGRNDAEAIQLASEGGPPPRSPKESTTVADLLERTKVQIAELTGFGPDQIRLTVTVAQ